MATIDAPTYSLIKDTATFLLTGIALYIGAAGLSTWKKQAKGLKAFDISYKLNYSVLKLRDAIKSVRVPAIWETENYEAIEYAKNKYPERAEDKDFLQKFSGSFVYEKRWERITQAYTEVESHLLAAEVLWGSQIREYMRPLRKKVNELNAALRLYLDKDLAPKDRETQSHIVYDMGDEDNPDDFTKDMNAHVGRISEYLQEQIR